MKILVVSLPDLKKIYPQRPHHLLKHLSQNHEITVISVNAWWLPEKEDDYLNNCLDGIKVVYPISSKYSPILQEILISKKLLLGELVSKEFDLLLNLHDLIPAYILAKKYKTPMVFDICDDIPTYITSSSQLPFFLKFLGGIIGKFLLNVNIKASKKITYTLDSLCKKYKVPPEKSVFIPNGVDTDLFYCRSEQSCEQLQISENDFIVGFVGFIGEWVDLELPLLALKKLRKDNFNIKMLVVGDGDKLPFFKDMAAKLNLTDDVIFTGSVQYNKIPVYISCMDVCLLPFKQNAVSNNALPLKLFEYMACEKPVISTKLDGVVSSVNDKVLYASNEDDFKNNIVFLYNNHELASKKGYEGRKFVEDNYSWNRIALLFEKELLEVVQ